MDTCNLLSFNSYIAEERKRPDVNKKLSAWEQLKEYVSYDPSNDTITVKSKTYDANTVYISLTNLFKIGVNPTSTYDMTPMGIYAYKLKNVWKKYGLEGNPMTKLPWAGAQPFIWVFVWNGKEVFEEDIGDMSADVYNNAVEKLKRYCIDKKYINQEVLVSGE
jgi:hypothetical protein